MRQLSRTVVICLMVVCFSAAGGAEVSGDLVIFHAGSLAVPFRDIAESFERTYPGVRVLREAAGSRISARKISDLNRPCDVMASADYAVIDSLLIPDHAKWNIRFAGNEMVIAYTDASRHAEELDADTWPEVIMRNDVAFGRSDPDADPCGYRTVLTAKLAEAHYGISGFVDRFLDKDRRFIRPKETDLIALLETRAIDFMFIYRSVAVQHGFRFLTLPDEINLKRSDLARHYASVSVEISGAEPGTTLRQPGEPMVYGVTIPDNAPNPTAALAFVIFLLEQEHGLAIMEKHGQPGLAPSVSTTYAHIPEPLKRFALVP